MNKDDDERNLLRIAEAIRAACLEAALESYEDAGMRGLCHEGAWECAIGAMRSLNLKRILEHQQRDDRTSQGKRGLREL
jgi:hypothetical protein